MLSTKFRLAVAVAALALGAGLGSGTAAANTGAAERSASPTISQDVVVLSDTINFSGTAVPVAPAGSYSLTSNQCSLTSDGEPIVFPCTITLKFSLATLTGTGRVNSADGIVQWNFRLAPTGAGNYSMTPNCSTGVFACYEIDSDGGPSVQYPASVSGTLTITPIPGTPNLKVTGRLAVSESPNSP